MQKTKIFNRSVTAPPCFATPKLSEGGCERSLMAAFASHGDRAPWLQRNFIAHKVFPGLAPADDRKSVAANQNFRRQWSRVIV